MIRGIRLSRKQNRALKRKLAVSTMCAIMVVSMSTNSFTVFAHQLTTETVMQEEQYVQTAPRRLFGSNDPSGENVTIDVSELSNENNERKYIISQPGTYTIKGTNFVNEGSSTSGGVYIPTSIVVKEGVKATLYLNGVTIINNDGKGYDGPPSSDGSTVTYKKATLPLSIEKNADVTLILTGNSEFGINEYGSAFDVAEGATVTLEASDYQLKISECNPKTYMDDTYAMNLFGTFVMNGSHLMITGKCNDDRIALNGTGMMTVNGGYFDFDRMYTIYSKQDRFVINGGQFNRKHFINDDFNNNNTNVSDKKGNTIHNFVMIGGLPASTPVTMCQQFYRHGDEKVEYGTENVFTDTDGIVSVDAGKHNLVKEASGDFTMIIKCGDQYYEAKYDPSAYQYSGTLTATPATAYKINFYSAGETPVLLDTIYTTVNSAGKAEYHYAGNYVAHSYKFYSSKDTTEEEFDFKLTASETNVYVVEGEKSYTVNVMFPSGGDNKSYIIPYGKNIAEYLNVDEIDIDDYILIDSPTASSSLIWDGYPKRDMTVFAHPCETVENERYMKISSANEMEAFRNYVNGGCTSLNGYLTADIDVGGFGGIYGGIGADEEHPYTGKFLGNRHTITLAMKNNDKAGSEGTCALFRYVGNGCELKGIDTAGTIYTKGKYAGGLVGTAKVLDGNILIDSCSSSVIITYDRYSQDDARCGGLVGCMSSNRDVEKWYTYDIHRGTITIRNCYYGGEMKKGQNAVNFKKQGGLIGLNDECWLEARIENCYVDADFDKTSGDDEYDCLIGENLGNSISTANFFYTKKCGESGYGEEYDSDSMTLSELAWRLNGGSFTGEYTNSKVWSYKDGSPVFADKTNKPIYQVRFVDEGVYDGKDKLDPVYGYTTPESQKVVAPAIPNDYLVAGQSAKWMVNTSEYSSDVTIEADTKAVLSITDTKTYTIEIVGDYEGTFTDVHYGSRLDNLFEGGENYIFISEDLFRHYTKVDGLATRFTAINLSGTQGQRQMDIKEASDLAIFAMLVNSGITDLDANLTADIDVSSIPDLAIGESRDCAYKGHFRGNMHTIKIGLVEDKEAEATGLFRYLDNCACIEKLTVEGTVKSSATYVGGIAGYYEDQADSDYDKKVSILNCTSMVSVEADGTEPYVGGILGYGKGNFVVKMCDYCGTIKTKGDAYCSGIAGCVDNNYNNNIFGCYVCMNVDTTGRNKGRNFGYLQDEWWTHNNSYEHCYYSGTGYGTQGTYVEKLSYANIYDMNSYAGEDMSLISYYDETSKRVKYCQGQDKAPLRITLTDPGVYENKKFEGYAYTDKDGRIVFPDMSSFLQTGHTAHWYLKDEPTTEITEGMKLDAECELILKVTSDDQHTISFDGTEENNTPYYPPVTPGTQGTDVAPSVPSTGNGDSAVKETEKNSYVIAVDTATGSADTGKLAGIVEKALAENKTDNIVLKFSNQSETVAEGESMSVNLERNALEMISKADNNISLTVATDCAAIELSSDVISSIIEQGADDVRLYIKKTNEEAAAVDRVSFEISLFGNGKDKIESFGGASVEVTVPVPETMLGKDVVAVYSDGTEHYSPVEGKISSDGFFSFRTSHFSEFILMTREEAEKLYNYISDFGTLKAHVKDRSDDTVTIDWDWYKDADGYIIYGNCCNHDGKTYKIKKIATIKDSSITEYTVKGLGDEACYKFRVYAYKLVDGKKYVTVKSNYVRSSVLGGARRFTTDIEIDQTGMKKTDSVTLKVDKSFNLVAKRYNDRKKEVFHSSIRYESSDETVATVSKNGKITAVGKGRCTILVIAENGFCEEITVKVK